MYCPECSGDMTYDSHEHTMVYRGLSETINITCYKCNNCGELMMHGEATLLFSETLKKLKNKHEESRREKISYCPECNDGVMTYGEYDYPVYYAGLFYYNWVKVTGLKCDSCGKLFHDVKSTDLILEAIDVLRGKYQKP